MAVWTNIDTASAFEHAENKYCKVLLKLCSIGLKSVVRASNGLRVTDVQLCNLEDIAIITLS